MDALSRICSREGIVRSYAFLLLAALGLLIILSFFWISGAPVEIKGPVAGIAVGALALFAGIALIARPQAINARLIQIFALSILILAWFLGMSLIKGSTLTVLTGTSFEPGTLFSFVAFISALLSGYIFSSADTGEKKNKRWLAWMLVTLAFVGAIFVLHKYNPEKVLIDSGGAHLSFDATMHTVLRAYGDDKSAAFIGTGLGTFGQQWAKYRPEWVGTSPMWNTDFATGSGLIPTLAVTIGFSATLFLVMLFAGACLEGASRIIKNRHETNLGEISILAALVFLFFWTIFYTPNLPLLLVFGILFGALLGEGDSKSAEFTEPESITLFGRFRTRNFWASAIISFIIAGIGISLLSFGVLRFLALRSYHQGIQALNADSSGDDESLKAFEQSRKYAKLPRTDRALARIYEHKAKALIEDSRNPPFKFGLAEAAIAYAENAVNYAREAAVLDGLDYRNWIELGSARMLSGILGKKEEFSLAVANYAHARALSPNHPLVYLLEAQALYLANDKQAAKKSLEKALELKPDYSDAIELQKRLFGTSGG